MGNNYTSGSGTSGNSSSFVSRREMRATNTTGALPVISTGHTYASSHFSVSSLVYREEEGFYVCKNCERTLGKQKLPMLRRQQKQ